MSHRTYVSQSTDELVYVSVDYEEFKPETFRGFVVAHGGESSRFDDWDAAVSHANSLSKRVLYMSSCDNYAADIKNRVVH